MGLNSKGELDIESIVSAPLMAASKANESMLKRQTRFMPDTCFAEADGVRTPVMVSMKLSRSSIDYTRQSSGGFCFANNDLVFEVPLISLLPINSLCVQSVDIYFNMEITSMNQKESVSQSHEKADVVLKGKIAKAHPSHEFSSKREQSSRNLNVKINASSLPLPKGVLELIDMYTKSIQPVQGSTDKTEE